MVGAFIGAFLVLTLLGTISIGLLIAVAFGGCSSSTSKPVEDKDFERRDHVEFIDSVEHQDLGSLYS
jgi:hypothetical protein